MGALIVEVSISKQQLILLVGAILLLIGAFLPVLSVPIMGSITLFNNGRSDGLIIVGLAVVAIALTVLNKINIIRIVAIASLAIVFFDLYRVYTKISNAKIEISEKLANNPFGNAASAMMDTIQLQYGWVVLIIGCLILLFGSFFKIVNPGEVRQKHRGAITEGKEPLITEVKPLIRKCRFCNAVMPEKSLKCSSCGSIN